ncbi:putative sensor histidine kinase response [Diaporthe ampelina]|uniref:Putative sensor histidine kinase response n=1 Tax=Diaporthe ampelina TaxID=1214573 RepID=A0A0G2HZA8_9PEZI|nr:putative sensor histidine kinase response [Diaporthe ampelina]
MDLIDQPGWAPAPSAPAADASVSENVRERETFKYDDLGWTSANPNDPRDPLPPAALASATDSSLTAYAQLAVHRLHAKRALISLFDRDHQHVVAEATRSSPLGVREPARRMSITDGDRLSACGEGPGDDGFWLCGTAIPRSLGICEHVLVSSFSSPAGASPDTEPYSGAGGDLPVSVVPDLATDGRFHTRPYIHGRPFNRFYAGVPIRSPGPDGVNIGVYCVFDTKPRPEGLTGDDIKFMQDMSRTIMVYLEYRGSYGKYRRSERMVRGMGNFVEGSDSLDPVLDGPARGLGRSSKRTSRILVPPDSAEGVRRREEMLAAGGRAASLPISTAHAVGAGVGEDEALASPGTPGPAVSTTDASPTGNVSPSLGPRAITVSAAAGSKASSGLAPDDSSRSSTPRPDSRHSAASTSTQQPAVAQVSSADLQLAESSRVFAKAANIIRQSVEVDGVLFLDATVRSFGGLVGQQNETGGRKVSSVGLDNISYLSNDEDAASQTQSAGRREDYCNVLGYSTMQGSTIGGDRSPWQFEGLRDRNLQRLLRRYPQGKVFNFDADGSVIQTATSPELKTSTPGMPLRRPASPTRQWSRDSQDTQDIHLDASSAQKKTATTQKRMSPAQAVVNLFPGARSVVLIPLWDGQKKRWSAGGFIWTRNPTRIFTTDGTVTFLRVFGLSVMAELYRLNTKAEETIKSNILGSISHELRSPLHGLVGAVELLHDSKLDSVQQNVLNIIETSGKTLVDTINHLLDYSKINSFIENDRADKKESVLGKVNTNPGERSEQGKTRSQTLPVELDCLVEEVVESVLAGYSHERMSAQRSLRDDLDYTKYKGAMAQRPATGTADPSQERVQIFLDIERSTSWRFNTHPGAFRRIVMNLFGNSLKFTRSGFIKVSLTQEPAKPYQHNVGATILLTVSDSGKGISEDYIQNHLFTPFCQEDNFAPGTGLGLSLVRQITVNLGGEIKVASQVGRGTNITVSLPLPFTGDAPVPGDPTGFVEAVQMLRGRKVLLRGFDMPDSDESRPAASGVQDVGKLVESQAHFLESTCRDWLFMEVLDGSKAGQQQPDLIIHHDSNVSFSDGERIAGEAECPVFFVCEAIVATRNFSYNLPDAASRIRTFDFFAPPFGPRKLARALVHLLGMWETKQEQAAQQQQQQQQQQLLPHHATSVDVLPTSATKGTQVDRVTVGSRVVPEREEREGHGVTVITSKRATVVADRAPPGSSAETDPTPLPTPPEESTLGGAVAVMTPVVERTNPMETVAKPASVLIVDDNAINLKILSAYMKKLKRPYVTAINGLESSEMYAHCPSDYCCILTDISMPIMDGLESARRIRQHERTNRLEQTPIIALTGLAGAGIQQDAVASGVDMFLTRPVTLKRLVEALESVGLDCKVW